MTEKGYTMLPVKIPTWERIKRLKGDMSFDSIINLMAAKYEATKRKKNE